MSKNVYTQNSYRIHIEQNMIDYETSGIKKEEKRKEQERRGKTIEINLNISLIKDERKLKAPDLKRL